MPLAHMRSWSLRALLCAALVCPAVARGGETVYRGLIDGRINVLITLDRPARGTVVYDATGGEGLHLEGGIDERGRFEWREVLDSYTGGEARAQHTGTFRGTLATGGAAGEGTWTSADGTRRASLNLTRVGSAQSIRADDVDAAVTFPQLEGGRYAALNTHLAATARERLAEHAASVRQAREEAGAELDPERLSQFTQSTACAVESVAPDLVSLLCAVYDYSGGAHGNTDYFAENFVLRDDGSFRSVGLWDALRKSPGTAKRLSDLILKELARKDASLVLSGVVTDLVRELESDVIPVTVIPAGLAFHFAPYAVGSYAEGGFRVVIPNRALGPFLRGDGPLARRIGAK